MAATLPSHRPSFLQHAEYGEAGRRSRKPRAVHAVACVALICIALTTALAGVPTAAAATKPSTTKPSATTLASAVARPGDRIQPDSSTFTPLLAYRRAIGAMQGDHRVTASLSGPDLDKISVTGNIDPRSGNARVRYRETTTAQTTAAQTTGDTVVAGTEPPNTTTDTTEVRIRNDIAFGVIPSELRSAVLADWYRVSLKKGSAEPPLPVLVSAMVANSPAASTYVSNWTETKDKTFGSATRHLHGTAVVSDALPLIVLFGNYEQSVTFDAWIDGSLELRRIRWTVKGKAVAATKAAKSAKAAGPTTVPTTPTRRGVDLTLSVDYRRRNIPLTVSTPTNVDDLSNVRKILDTLNAQQAQPTTA